MAQLRKPLALLAVAALALLAGCSGTPDASAPAESEGSGLTVGPPDADTVVEIETVDGLFDKLPDAIKDRGKLVVGVEANAGLPNSVSTPEGELRGLIVDTAYALGKTIGIDVELAPTTFDQIIPGLEAGRYDLGTNTFSVTEERLQAVDFVNHLVGVRAVLLVQADNDEYAGKLTVTDACGLSVGVNKGGVQVLELEKASAQCVEEGKEPIDIQLFPSNPEAVLAVKSGRTDASIFQYTQTMTYASEDASLAAGGLIPGITSYVGMALPKGSEAQDVIREAMLVLYDSGVWMQILKLYSIEDQAPTEEVILATGLYVPEDDG
ncbi:transporter substrate-binding domain-containing protein [Microbacterium sp. USHLN186]|uniref:transporter substrate-binding domain-containing protein n=1 Tax=Microbacterium sp. USHLN186 TaxID=3081286 RepID=UPI00301678F6